jgi:hypothetical protein
MWDNTAGNELVVRILEKTLVHGRGFSLFLMSQERT